MTPSVKMKRDFYFIKELKISETLIALSSNYLPLYLHKEKLKLLQDLIYIKVITRPPVLKRLNL